MDEVNIPMLLLSPANSAVVPMDDQKQLIQAAKAKMKITPGHEHDTYLGQAELYQQKCLQFLKTVKK